MFYIFPALTFKSIFSIQGITFIAVISFLIWLLKDYPKWKTKKVSLTQNSTSSVETTDLDPLIDFTPPVDSSDPTHDLDKKVSLLHYILVSPFAALYIIARATIDLIRFSLYTLLWSIERSLPHLDDWLFDLVTVRLPKGYQQFSTWSTETAQPAFERTLHYLTQTLLPNLIHYTEATFIKLYQIGCQIQTIMIDVKTITDNFIARHDWHQLGQDLAGIFERLIWNPFEWTVIKTSRLIRILYGGIRGSLISIYQDIQWIVVEVIPQLYQMLASTRLAHGTVKFVQGLMAGLVRCGEWISPILNSTLSVLVKCVDRLILMAQGGTILKKLYRKTGPIWVWFWLEALEMGMSIGSGLIKVLEETYPAYRLFQTKIKPPLKVWYGRLVQVVSESYWGYVYPAFVQLYPYLNRPIYLLFEYGILPVYREVWAGIVSLMNQKWLGELLMKTASQSMIYGQLAYGFVQSWMIKQAPVLASLVQTVYVKFMGLVDWTGLYKDMTETGAQLYLWVAEQSNLIYASLERSLSVWERDNREDKIKKDN